MSRWFGATDNWGDSVSGVRRRGGPPEALSTVSIVEAGAPTTTGSVSERLRVGSCVLRLAAQSARRGRQPFDGISRRRRRRLDRDEQRFRFPAGGAAISPDWNYQ